MVGDSRQVGMMMEAALNNHKASNVVGLKGLYIFPFLTATSVFIYNTPILIEPVIGRSLDVGRWNRTAIILRMPYHEQRCDKVFLFPMKKIIYHSILIFFLKLY